MERYEDLETLRTLYVPVIRNTNGHGLNPDCPATVLHQHPAPIHPASKTSAAALEEVEAVVLDVEANQVAAQDTLPDSNQPTSILMTRPVRLARVKV